MLTPLAQIAIPGVTLETLFSAGSLAITGYYWLVRSRQERPNMKFFQLRDYRATLRRGESDGKTRRLALTQVEPGGVLAANNSLRQTSIIRFDCFLKYEHFWLKGDWGYIDEDKPPWNIGPQSSIALSPACFFDVPEDYEVPENTEFRVEFITATGKRFSHKFWLKRPE